MRIAFVVGSFPILSETFVLDQITGLIERGAEVDIFPRWGGTDEVRHESVARYRLLERTWNPRPEPRSSLARRARIATLLGHALVAGPPTPSRFRRLLRHGRGDANQALGFHWVRRRVPRRYDAIHCHFGTHGYLGLSLRSMGILGGPLLTTFHGYDMSRVVRVSGTGYYDRLFEEGDLFLPVSKFWRSRLIELGCPPDRIRVHRMGVDTRRFPFRPRSLPAQGPLKLISVARLTEKKGLAYAIRAVDALVRAGEPVEYTIIGDGPLRGELESLVTAAGLDRHVRMPGRRPQGAVRGCLDAAHVVLAPSVTADDGNMEGIPVALMEAMAMGLPVISTFHSGIPELVRDGETGLLVEERAVDGLAQRIRELAGDAELYARLSVAGRRLVERQHDVDRLNDRLYALLADLPSALPGPSRS